MKKVFLPFFILIFLIAGEVLSLDLTINIDEGKILDRFLLKSFDNLKKEIEFLNLDKKKFGYTMQVLTSTKRIFIRTGGLSKDKEVQDYYRKSMRKISDMILKRFRNWKFNSFVDEGKMYLMIIKKSQEIIIKDGTWEIVNALSYRLKSKRIQCQVQSGSKVTTKTLKCPELTSTDQLKRALIPLVKVSYHLVSEGPISVDPKKGLVVKDKKGNFYSVENKPVVTEQGFLKVKLDKAGKSGPRIIVSLSLNEIQNFYKTLQNQLGKKLAIIINKKMSGLVTIDKNLYPQSLVLPLGTISHQQAQRILKRIKIDILLSSISVGK